MHFDKNTPVNINIPAFYGSAICGVSLIGNFSLVGEVENTYSWYLRLQNKLFLEIIIKWIY